MKNKYIALILATSGLLGCTNHTSDVAIMPTDNNKENTDTALVLSKTFETYYTSGSISLLTANKQGKTKEFSTTDRTHTLYKHSNTGDTVIVQGDKIVRNLTMENKIKAFSNQR